MGNARQAAMTARFRHVTAMLLCLGGMGFCARPMKAQEPTRETRVKAENLTRVLSFVQWPSNWMGEGNGAFHMCVLGDYWLVYALAEETRTTTVSGRKIEVKRAQKEQELKGCQMVFVSRTEAKRYEKILEETKGTSALTVGETDGFL